MFDIIFFVHDFKKQPPEVFCKKWPSDLQLYKKETLTDVLSCDIWEIYKNICFEERLETTASGFWNEQRYFSA